MQTDNQKESAVSQKGDMFASSSLMTGYFYSNQNEQNQEHHNQSEISQAESQSPSHQQLLTPQPSTRRRPKPLSTPPSNQPQPNEQPAQSQSPQRKPKAQRRTYKKTTNKRNIQELEQELETLDDEELQKHDLIMLSKESGMDRDRDREGKQEEVFQLDDLEAEYEVEQGVGQGVEQGGKEQQLQEKSRVQKRKKELPLKVRQQVVFQQSSQQQQQGESPQRLHPPKPIPQSSQSLSSPQKQPQLSQNYSQLKQPQSPSKNEITRQHMLKILTYPVKQNMVMKTNVERVSGFIFNTYPEYHVYFESDRTHLLSAKRVSRTPFSTFVVSRSKTDFEEGSEDYLGKAKGSALGDMLNLFGRGLSPANALLKKVKPRQLLATIVYETRIILAGQPRNFKVYIKKPEVDYYQHFPQIKIYGEQISLNLLYQNPHNRQHITVLENKQPTYNPDIKGYSLNFRGRVGMASVKNFILEKSVSESEQQTAVEPSENEQKLPQLDTMIFGKAKGNMFNMDLGSPLSPLIAFGVALSTFDEKYFCE